MTDYELCSTWDCGCIGLGEDSICTCMYVYTAWYGMYTYIHIHEFRTCRLRTNMELFEFADFILCFIIKTNYTL